MKDPINKIKKKNIEKKTRKTKSELRQILNGLDHFWES